MARSTFHRWAGHLADLCVPVGCPICREPIAPSRAASGQPWCRPCGVRLAAEVLHPPAVVESATSAPGLPVTMTAAAGSGAVRSLVRAWKDDRRDDLAPFLAQLLSGSASAALAGVVRQEQWYESPILMVPIPSALAARRRRGGWPVRSLADAVAREMAERATDGCSPVLDLRPVLISGRARKDQRSLSAPSRHDNMRGSLTMSPRNRPLVLGRAVLLVDDIVTTGASLAEGARVLRESGARAVFAATCVATVRSSSTERVAPHRIAD